jgi:hypothetical protein
MILRTLISLVKSVSVNFSILSKNILVSAIQKFPFKSSDLVTGITVPENL